MSERSERSCAIKVIPCHARAFFVQTESWERDSKIRQFESKRKAAIYIDKVRHLNSNWKYEIVDFDEAQVLAFLEDHLNHV